MQLRTLGLSQLGGRADRNSGFGGEGVPLPDGARLGFPCPLFALADHHARERDTPSSRSARLRRTWPRGPVVALTEQGRLRQRQPQVAHVAFVIDPAGGHQPVAPDRPSSRKPSGEISQRAPAHLL